MITDETIKLLGKITDELMINHGFQDNDERLLEINWNEVYFDIHDKLEKATKDLDNSRMTWLKDKFKYCNIFSQLLLKTTINPSVKAALASLAYSPFVESKDISPKAFGILGPGVVFDIIRNRYLDAETNAIIEKG